MTVETVADASGQDARGRLLRIATVASLATAAVLVVGKLGAWLMTGSLGILASLVDSLMDAAASLINFFAVRYSLMPADADHRFGHGKAEALAALAQATFIAGSSIFLVLQAVDRLLHPRPLTDAGIGIGVMVFAILATLLLLAIQRHVIRRTGSTAIRADSLHYVTDVLVNLSIIAALVLSSFGWGHGDPVIALGIAVYILRSAYSIGVDALNLLMDRELPEAERQQMLEIARTHARTHGVHDLRTRQSGATKFVQLHLELDDDLSLSEAHAIATEVEVAIKEAFPETDIVIHQDPASIVPK